MLLSDIKNKKVYISGKMTGLSVDEIFEKFNSVEKELLSNGNGVINPAIMWHLGDTTKFEAQEYLHIDFAMMDICDTIIVLPNYETSSGARKEISYAYATGKTCYFLQEDGTIKEAGIVL